jgi:hypothetical protein
MLVRLNDYSYYIANTVDRTAAGLKAAIHNPRVSDEAKANAQERLDERNAHQIGGLKAALHNPRVSDEAKADVREKLEERLGHTYTEGENVTDEHFNSHQLG